MLTISKPLGASQAASYYTKEFANASGQYYSQDGAIVGQWHGRLMGPVGLSPPIEQAHFLRVAEGEHPLTGERLIRRRASTTDTLGHRAGYDATFSAPKSVSLVALVGGDERVREAHRASVTTALDALERFAQARMGGAKAAQTTGHLLIATFEHDSARPVDGYAAPQLHTHCVVANMTQTAGGIYRALQPRELYKSQSYATAVYRAALATRLQALGYQLDRGAAGQPEIRGLSAEYLAKASPRRKQILDHLAARHVSGAAAQQIAAHHTRERKTPHGPAEVQRQHQEMAAAFGHQPQRAVAAARTRGPAVVQDQAHDALTYAKSRAMERSAVVDERVVLTDALRRGMGATTLPAVEAEFRARVAAGEFEQRPPWPGSAAPAWTTPEMIALEQGMIARMRQGQEARRGPLATPALAAAIAREPSPLSASQRAAVAQILASRHQVMALDGRAGTGKTTTLAAVRAAAERAGYAVEGLAPTSRAALVLAEAGMPTQTLQRALMQTAPLPSRPRLLVLDESSLASTVLMKDFLDRMRPQDRVLLVGDARQHQSVDAGKAYQQLQEAGMETARLTTIVRQPDPQLQTIVAHLAEGRVAAALVSLHARGNIHVVPDRAARLAAVAAAVVEDPRATLVVCPDNQSRQEMNTAIRGALQTTRAVAADHPPVRVLVARQEMTGTDRIYADRYDLGDRIRYTKGSPAIGLEAGTYATVTAHDRAQNLLTVARADGSAVTYDPRRLHGVSVYQEEARTFAVGDRVQFTAPARELRVANREMGTIAALSAAEARITLDTGRTVALDLGTAPPHLDFGYAVTSHSSQGQTADRVVVHIDSVRSGEAIVNQRLAYVALSRGRYDLQVYTDAAPALLRNLSRDVSHRAAVEQAPAGRRQAPVPALAHGDPHD